MQADLTIQRNDARPGGGRGVLIFLLFAAAAGLLAWMLAGQAGVTVLPEDEAGWAIFEPAEMGRVLVVVDPAYSHADERHPKDAPLVRKCLDDQGPFMNFLVDRALQRYLRTCVMPDGQIGFQIVDKIKGRFYEKTAYIRNDINGAKELLRYIDRVKYSRYKGPIN